MPTKDEILTTRAELFFAVPVVDVGSYFHTDGFSRRALKREETRQGWLGEKDSNPHSQSQNLMSYP